MPSSSKPQSARGSGRSSTGSAPGVANWSMRSGGRCSLRSKGGASQARRLKRPLLWPGRTASIGSCTPSHLLTISHRTRSAASWGSPWSRNASSSIPRAVSCSAMTGVLTSPWATREPQREIRGAENRSCSSPQTSEQQSNHRHLDEGFAGLDLSLIVFTQSPGSREPAKRALDYPPAWLNAEFGR